MIWNRVAAPTAQELSLLRKSFNIGTRSIIQGMTDKELEFLSAVQIKRLVALRDVLDGLKSPLSQGEFSFSKASLQGLHGFIDKEPNVVQRVAFKNMLAKLKSDLVVLGRLQEQMAKPDVAARPEAWKERLHDEVEDLGEDISRGFVTLVTSLNQSVQSMRGLASSSLYRASLSSERQMYSKLEREGRKMLRRWNDVRLEVSNLLATRNHDPKSKSNLERMEADLIEILGYLDEYALIPWLAGRDVIAAITILDRRLENYQDEYNLAQTDADRIANIIEDRDQRDEAREKIGEKVVSFMNYLGVSKNLSIGGVYRLTRAMVRGASKTGKFVFRTVPNAARSLATSARTFPQRVTQTIGQLGRMVRGTLFGRRASGNTLNVRFDDMDPESDASFNRGLAGYARSDSSIAPAVADTMNSSGGPTPTMDTDGSGGPTPRDIHDDVASNQSGYPGSTSPVRRVRAGRSDPGLRSFMTERFDRMSLELSMIRKEIRRTSGSGPAPSGVSASGYEAEELRKEAELDTLKAIQASLERIAGRSPTAAAKEGSTLGWLGSLLGKLGNLKSWMGGILEAIGGWKLFKNARGLIGGIVKGIATIGRPLLGFLTAGITKLAGPMLRMGSMVGRMLTGPIGMVLGSGLAGWEIGSAIYEKFAVQIADLIDSSIAGVNATLDWIKSKIDLVWGIISKGAGWLGDKAKDLKNQAITSSLDKEMKQNGGITSASRAVAEGLGVDTSKYPSYSLFSGVGPAPAKATPSSAPTLSSSSATMRSESTYSAPSLMPPSTPASPGSSVAVRSMSGSSTVSPSLAAPMSQPDRGARVLSSSSNYTAAADANMDGLQPSVRNNFEAMVAEYKQNGGTQPVKVNRAFATFDQQAAMYKKYGPGRAAKPGNSAHNYGIAIDADRGALNDMDRMGLLSKYGFERPVSGEPWHLQVAGVSAAMAKNGVFSADNTAAQGDRSSPSKIAGIGTANQPTTQVTTKKGSSPESAAYSAAPRAPASAQQGGSDTTARSSVQATPAGHGTARIPEFSWNDPTFFALNLGALTS